MRFIRYIIVVFVLVFTLNSCTDNILDQPPKDAVELDEYFNSANDLEIATNDLFTLLPGVGVYTDDANSDNILQETVASKIKGSRVEPTDKGSGGWSWSQLRRINFILENYHKVDDEDAKAKYSGITRFYRAY